MGPCQILSLMQSVFLNNTYILLIFLAVLQNASYFKGIQWLKINFCIQFTYSILGIDVFVKKDSDIMSTLFMSF